MLASAIGISVLNALNGARSGEEEPRPSPTTTAGDFRDDLLAWFRMNRRSFTWRDRELNPWQVLMLEMCLHRTHADQVR